MPRAARAGLRLQRDHVTREEIERRPKNLWRYRELLPITGEPRTGFNSGFTPLVRCDRLAEAARRPRALHQRRLGQPSDAVLQGPRRLGGGHARRGARLQGAGVRVHRQPRQQRVRARRAARPRVLRLHPRQPRSRASSSAPAIFSPTILAIAGNYDDVNRLCTQVADRYGWGFVNINLRSYYAEGAKTMGFEIVEQLGWRYPQHVVSPVAGGTLLPRIVRGLRELRTIGLVEGELPRIHAAQAAGCAPVVHALEAGLDHPEPVRPDTIAKSIAIGNPADGYQVLECVRETGGTGAAVTDAQIIDAIQLLAETEGHLHRAGRRHDAGGHRRPDSARRHSARRIDRRLHHRQRLQDGRVVQDRLTPPVRLSRAFKEFEAWWEAL